MHVVWVVGSITFGLAIIAAFSARETFRIHLNDLGNKDAQPIPRGVRPAASGGLMAGTMPP